MPSQSLVHTVEPWRRFRSGIGAVLAVVVVGTVGYRLLGLGWFDSLYQTVITITTVGFSEIGIEDDSLLRYRMLTLTLAVTGVGAVLYTIAVTADSLIEGSLNDDLRRRRMLKSIDQISDHTIVAGWGQVGKSVAHYVGRSGQQTVVIDRNPAGEEPGFPIVVGEATDDAILLAAGLERAKTLVLALDHDADNLFVCLSARSLRPDLFIVARTSDQKNDPKFLQAGANRVINPHEIGGSRMAALAMHPNVAEFIDEVLHDDQHDVAVEEVTVHPGSKAIGKPVADLREADGRRSLVIAIRKGDGRYRTNPPPKTELAEGDVIIALGSADELAALRRAI